MGSFATTPNAGITVDEYQKILRDNGVPDEVALKLYRALPTADEKGSFPSGASASDPLALASAIPTTGWQTRYSVDFSALGVANDIDIQGGGDGAVVIDGKTWQVTGTSNATAWDVTDGTGILWDTSGGTYDYGGSKDSPYLYALLSSLWSGYNVANHKVRLWCYFNFVPVNNWDSFMMMMERQGEATELMAGAIRLHNGSTVDEWRAYHGSVGGANGVTATTSHTSDNVMCVEQTERGLILRTGLYSGGFPAIETMNLHGHVTFNKSGDLLLGFEQGNASVGFSNFKNTGAPADATLVAFQLDSIG